MKRFMQIFFFATLLLFCTGCQKKLTVSNYMFNTYVSITVYGEDNAKLAEEALELGREYEQIFSRTLPESSLSLLNSQKTLANADSSLYELIETGLLYCELTDGNLDITIEPLTSLWNITGTNPTVPSEEDIQSALKSVDYKNVLLTENNTISIENGASIDLGAIAKGYIADKMKEFLIENGVSNGIINLGGNVVCIGDKPDGSPYTIGIRDPKGDNSVALLTLQVNDLSVVTSGTYERFFTEGNITYHHILDPKTGSPSHSGLVSVTIISKESVVGDCLSTACLVMGREDALKLLNSLDNVYGILIDEDNNIYYSEGATAFLNK